MDINYIIILVILLFILLSNSGKKEHFWRMLLAPISEPLVENIGTTDMDVMNNLNTLLTNINTNGYSVKGNLTTFGSGMEIGLNPNKFRIRTKTNELSISGNQNRELLINTNGDLSVPGNLNITAPGGFALTFAPKDQIHWDFLTTTDMRSSLHITSNDVPGYIWGGRELVISPNGGVNITGADYREIGFEQIPTTSVKDVGLQVVGGKIRIPNGLKFGNNQIITLSAKSEYSETASVAYSLNVFPSQNSNMTAVVYLNDFVVGINDNILKTVVSVFVNKGDRIRVVDQTPYNIGSGEMYIVKRFII
jgi:hypothetical protein